MHFLNPVYSQDKLNVLKLLKTFLMWLKLLQKFNMAAINRPLKAIRYRNTHGI